MDNQDRNHNYCECVTLYLTDCRGRGLSESTIAGKLSNLHLFFDWCEQHEIHGLRRIHLGVLEAYRNHLPEIRQVINGRPLTRGTQRNRLIAVKMLFRYLAENGLMEEDPAKKLIVPKPHRALPQGALSFEEATVVLDSIQPTNIRAIRDRTLLETFFATGIRRMELANLNKGDINLSNEMLFIKNGKGGKDRYLPIASRACRWISKYLFEARPHLKSERTGEALFLDTKGMRFRGHQLTRIVSEVFRKTGIRHKGSCHVFRHTVARLMLENGADIRYIQEMLGHADISTTQIYTFVAIPKLREVYDRTHPAATKDQSHSFT